MIIAKIWKNDYPWDVRVEKFCKTLINDGNKVHLICNNLKGYKTRDEIDGFQIHRLYPIKNKILKKICSLPFFFNPFWLHKIFKVVKDEKIEAIIVRDLPLVLSALLVGKIYKIPVIYDMAENYPAMWDETVSRKGVKLYNYFLKNSELARIIENYVLKRVDHIIVVVEESKKKLLKKGIPDNKLSIVSNTPDLKLFKKRNNGDERFLRDRFKLLYVGGIDSESRGLDTVIKSIPFLKEKIENLYFIVIGDGEYLEDLIKIVRKLGVEKYVRFCGWVDFKLVPTYIYNCDVCVVPHNVNEHINSTIPNKLFEYMACKKPVIVSDAIPLKRIVEENNCGVVFNSKDVTNFAGKVMELQDPSARTQMGENGYYAVIRKYNWAKDSQVLRDLFKKWSGR